MIAGGAAASLGTAGGIVVAGLGPGAVAAYAAWSPTPTIASPGQVSAADSLCVEEATQSFSQATPALGVGAPQSWRAVADDVRGPYTLVVLEATSATGTDQGSCLTGPGALATGSLMVAEPSGSATTPAPGTVSQGYAFGPGSDTTVLVGAVGSGVSGVTIALSDGTRVTATVANGFYAAWWPGDFSPVSTTVTTVSGTSTQRLAAPASGRVIAGVGPARALGVRGSGDRRR
ncbi:MAG: hypothetical protein ACRDZR_07105 [Acidimicrobiales bacterium]